MGLILITHDLRVAFAMCDRIYVLYAGSLLEVAPAAAARATSRCTRTRSGCCSPSRRGDRRLAAAARRSRASVPAPDDVAGRCPFSAALPLGGDRCLRRPDRRCARSRDGRRRPACGSTRSAPRCAASACEASQRAGVEPPSPAEHGRSSQSPTCARSFVAGAAAASTRSHGVSIEVGRGRERRPRRRVGLRARRRSRAASSGSRRRPSGTIDDRRHRRHRLRAAQRRATAPRASQRPDRLPGSVLVAQPGAHDRLGAAARRCSPPSRALATLATQVGELLARVGLPRRLRRAQAGRRCRAASASASRSPARSRSSRSLLDLRRARLGARRLGPGADPQPASRRCATSSGSATSSSPTTSRSCARSSTASTCSIAGRSSRRGRWTRVLGRPSHEYTQKLVDSIPRSDSEWLTAQQTVMGVVPDGD